MAFGLSFYSPNDGPPQWVRPSGPTMIICTAIVAIPGSGAITAHVKITKAVGIQLD